MTDRKTALVTGSNRGLGFETARQLGKLGYRVIVTARNPADAERAGAELGKMGIEARALGLDVGDREAPGRVAEYLRREGIKLDVLVNNAGTTLDGFDARVAERTIDVNYRGAERVSDALASELRDGATIVNVSSGMGDLSALGPELRKRFSNPELGREQLHELGDRFVKAVAEKRHQAEGWPSNAYRVSKAALNAFTRILAKELAPRKIRVNAVCPGWVRTRMGGSSAERSVEQGASGIVWAATLAENGPSGGFFRDGQPIDW